MKEKKESFIKGVITLIIAQGLIKIMGLVYKLYITNKEGFGDKGNAIYNSGFVIYALLLTVSSVGVPNAVAKLVSEKISKGEKYEANRIFKVALITFAFIGMTGTCILLFGAKYIANVLLKIPEAELTLVALSPSIFFVSIVSVIRGYFNGMQKLKATANSQTLEQLFKTILTILIVEVVGIKSNLNVELMAAGANLATTLATMVGFTYLYKYYKKNKMVPKERYKRETKTVFKIIKEILYVSIPISMSSILASINGNIDAVTVKRKLMKFLTEDIAQKQYGILSGKVATLVTLPLSFNIAFSTALVPAISSAKARGEYETINKKISFSVLASIIIGLPCAFGFVYFAEPILRLLFPSQPEGKAVLQVCAIGIFFMLVEQTINGILQGLGKVFVPAMGLGIGVIVKLILNLTLIPIKKIGILGAAIGTVCCHLISLTISFSFLKKNVEIKFPFKKFILKPSLATGTMIYISKEIYDYLKCILPLNLATIIVLIFAVIIYCLLILLLKIFTKEETLGILSRNGQNKLISVPLSIKKK